MAHNSTGRQDGTQSIEDALEDLSEQLRSTYRALEAKGIEYTRIDSPEGRERLKEMGYLQAPIVVSEAWIEQTLRGRDREHSKPDAEGLPELVLALLGVAQRRPVLAMSRMLQSVEALGPALAEPEVDTSPQLARSLQATENVWREMEREFGLLTSLEVSERLGSTRPNRSYASDQHSRGRLIAIRRPGGMRFPGFQIDPNEQAIRPVMAELTRIARDADVSEASLALWLCAPTGYLDGARPVDRLDRPEEVVKAAESAFGVQW